MIKNEKLGKIITEYIAPKTDLIIDYGDFEVKVNEDVDFGDINEVVELLVTYVSENDYDYQYYDVLLAEKIIELFTDIPIPTIENFDIDSEETETIDYVECYKIATSLNLKNNLMEASPIVLSLIESIEVNAWRKLDYLKAVKPYTELMSAIGEFYNILDELSEVIEINKDVDVDKLVSQLAEVSEQYNMINSTKNGAVS